MPAPTQTLYDVLGVPPQASGPEIVKAYKRLVEEFGKATTAPDPRREALIRSAYATLSDDARRDEYDASLAARNADLASRLGVRNRLGEVDLDQPPAQRKIGVAGRQRPDAM